MAPSTVTFTKTIHAPASKAVAFCHDPQRLPRLNPLVTSVTQSPTDPGLYTIRERITIFGFIPFTTEALVRFTATEDGVDCEVDASSFVGTLKAKNEWRVRAQGEDTCEVTETVVLETNALLMPFVMSTLKKSRAETHNTLAKQLEGQDDISRITLNTKSGDPRVMLAVALVGVAFAMWSTFWDVSKSSRSVCICIKASFLLVWLAFSRLRASDPYGSYHIAFNVSLGDDPNKRPATEWLNMGYWKSTKVFPQACEGILRALALRLVKDVLRAHEGCVLDVGHACGDSLLLHLRHTDVPRPASLTGITSLPSQHARALERIAEQQSSAQVQSTGVTLFCGDAVFRPGVAEHPLNAASTSPQFTTILALDCAYHFVTREIFLRQCFARLAPGGNIALADLVVSEPLPFSLRAVLSRLLSVPSENMVTPHTYEMQLKTIGYANISIEDISDDVFPGFRLFLKSRGGAWHIFELVIGWWVKAGGRFVIVRASRPERMSASD